MSKDVLRKGMRVKYIGKNYAHLKGQSGTVVQDPISQVSVSVLFDNYGVATFCSAHNLENLPTTTQKAKQ
jgi:hypothetical protein